MGLITATVSNWFLIGPISVALGWIMNWIFEFLDLVGIPNIGLAIIIFTFVIKALMLPLSIKQQKFSKLQAVMQPELNAIQEKYKGKKDNESVMAQQQETKDLYSKYGVNPAGGCVQLLIQMPILFALYQVIYHMPGHISKLKAYYEVIASKLVAIKDFASAEGFSTLVSNNGIKLQNLTDAVSAGNNNYVIDLLYKLSPNEWSSLFTMYNNNSGLVNAYNAVAEKITNVNTFLGINLTMKPSELLFSDGKVQFTCWWVIFIPILAGGLQFLSTKLVPNNNQGKNNEGGAAGMMKSMNIVMPLMSVVFCFMFEAGLGIYWVASSGVQCLIQLVVNKYIDRVNIDDMIEKNLIKVNEKRAKKGLKPIKAGSVTSTVHTIEEGKEREEAAKKYGAEKAKTSSAYYDKTTTAKKGSLAAKAGMVQQYNDRQKELKGKN